MSESAVQNLTESLDLIKCTLEARKPDVDVNVNVYVSGGEEEEAYTHKHQNPEIPLFRIMQQNPQ